MSLLTRKVAMIGVGNVGMAGVYAMYLRNSCEELVLVDKNMKKAEAEAIDLMHGQAFTGKMTVRASDYSGLSECQVIVITAGVNQQPGETRLALLERNAFIFKDIAHQIDLYAPNALVVVASNPVDILTHMMQELSIRDNHKIIGTGTMLDTSRLRTLVGNYYDVNPQSVHGYILGEHGDSEVAAWSTVTIGGLPLVSQSFLGKDFDQDNLEKIAHDVQRAAYKIIDGKGYTNLAIGVCIARLIESILDDSKSILPVSVRVNGEYGLHDITLSVPARVGIDGVDSPIELKLSDDELTRLRESGETMRECLNSIGF